MRNLEVKIRHGNTQSCHSLYPEEIKGLVCCTSSLSIVNVMYITIVYMTLGSIPVP